MADLEAILRGHGIDISSLKALHGEGSYVIYTLTTHGSAAIALWTTLRGLVEDTGYWPVVVGDDDALGLHLRALKEYEYKHVPEIIDASRRIDAATYLRETFETMYDGEDEEEDLYPHDEWPSDIKPNTDFSTVFQDISSPSEHGITITRAVLPLAYIVLLPPKVSWQVPAYLKVGNWNYCPGPEEQCAVFRYWEEKYGAEFVCMEHDTFELQVARPPKSRKAAMALAEEQYGYCPDIVDQGVDSLEALAATLLNGHIWFFWWD